jgi:hypothetical protein
MARQNLPADEAAPRAVYDGRDRLGSILQRGTEYEALDRQGRTIGKYTRAGEATAAVVRRALTDAA